MFNYCADCRRKKADYDRTWRMRLKLSAHSVDLPDDIRSHTPAEYTGDDCLTFCNCRHLPDGRIALEIR